jgi:Glycerol-3-phosphate dehydrogenase
MNVCIIGGGNIGTSMAAYFSQNNHKVIIYSLRYIEFSNQLIAIDNETKSSFITEISATDNLQKALGDAKMVCITYPSFLLEETFEKIRPFLKSDAIIGVIPGTGGVEFIRKQIPSHTLFGFDRVPGIARIKEYGKSVYYSKKKSTRVAVLPREQTDNLCIILSKMLGLECIPLKNYLTITLMPSNPILHTARTYSMFKDYTSNIVYERNFLFYKEWDERSSQLLFAMDRELQQICAKLPGIDLSEVISVSEHYEAETSVALTKKISNIATLASIGSPMKAVEGGFIPNFNSRYFTEDVPYGLTIIRGFAQIAGVKTPHIDAVLRWSGKQLGETYFDDNGNMLIDKKAITPQKFGIHTISDVYDFYENLANNELV